MPRTQLASTVADNFHERVGLLVMILILCSRREADSDMAATLPVNADWRWPTSINVSR
jgi:hypothetical protein